MAMKKIDMLLIGAPVLIFIAMFLKTGSWAYLALPAAILLILPILIRRGRADR